MNTAENLLPITAALGIGASLLVAVATSSPTIGIAVCCLATLSIAGVAWIADQQNTQIAKNRAAMFAEKTLAPGVTDNSSTAHTQQPTVF